MVEIFDVSRSAFEQPFQQLRPEIQPELAKMLIALIGQKLLTPETLSAPVKLLLRLQVIILFDDSFHPDVKCSFTSLMNMIDAATFQGRNHVLLEQLLKTIETISTDIILEYMNNADMMLVQMERSD